MDQFQMERMDGSEVNDEPTDKVHNSVDTVEKPVLRSKNNSVHNGKRRRTPQRGARDKIPEGFASRTECYDPDACSKRFTTFFKT